MYMTILLVGPTAPLYSTIAAAMLSAVAGDTVQLESGYGNETATVSQPGMTVDGDANSTGIVLQLGAGVTTLTLTGTAPISILDGADANGIVGNAGDNIITVSGGVDAVDGGSGIDRLVVDYHLATGAVTGDSTSNFTEAGGGGRMVTITNGTIENFTVLTGTGSDTITTGAGDDVINAGDGANTITAGQGRNSIMGGNDADTVTALDGGNLIDGGDGTNVLTSGAGDDAILSGTGADTIVAGAGADAVTVRGGADTVDAGPGEDRLTVDYSAMTTDVTGGITGGNLATGYVGHIADLVAATVDLQGVENFTITTGTGNDTITTGDGIDVLDGGAGNDTLAAGGGDDALAGGAGNDTMDGGAGTDKALYSGQRGDYTITDNAGTITVVDNRLGSPDGTDTLTNIEGFLFANTSPDGAVIITGTAEEDQVLTASNTLDDADGLGTVTYQWQSDGVAIAGATGTTLTLGQAEVGSVITVVGSYTDQQGTLESVPSAPTDPVANVNDLPDGAVIITGTAEEDQVLTASNTLDDADGLGTVTYQWQSDGVAIAGATGATLTLGQAEVGSVITVVGSYTDQQGTLESVPSAPTDVVTINMPPPLGLTLAPASDSGTLADNITNIVRPTITGTGVADATVTLFDGNAVIGTGTVTSGGLWAITTASALAEGHNTFTATQTATNTNMSQPSTVLDVMLDTVAPGVAVVSASPPTAVLGNGASVTLTLELSETVLVNTAGGPPTLTLNNGATASYVSGSGTATLSFDYTVAFGQNTPDLAVLGANLNGATITDAAGNAVDLVGAINNPTGTLAIVSVAAFDTSTNQVVRVVSDVYAGPVLDIQYQYINITPDNLNVSSATPNYFIHSGSGDDAIAVSAGTNVLDGGTGSNFLSGGSGRDTFFVDNRGAVADTWSTIFDFHAGDAATIWGMTPADFRISFAEAQGAAGYTGLTLHATAADQPTTSMTFVGYNITDLSNGRLSQISGIDPVSGGTYTTFQAS
jgi:hypothetical protein